MSLYLCSLANISSRKHITRENIMNRMEYLAISVTADLLGR